MSGSQPTQTHHTEALILAFTHSRAHSLVGTDALRTVIHGSYREMLRGDNFELDSLWTLLEAQPGFEAADVMPPLCRFKTWEGDLEINVILPPQLGVLSALDVRALADECPVPSKELDRILERGAFTKGERAARAAKWAEEPAVEVPETTAAPTHTGLSFSAFSPPSHSGALQSPVTSFTTISFAPRPPRRSQPELFTGIPVKKAIRSGFDVTVIQLTNEGWFSKPREEREAAMRSTMTELARDGIRGLFVHDKTGKVRAIAQTFGAEQSKIRIKFK